MAACATTETQVLPEQRTLALAALWLAFLTPFFFLSYGFANSVTSLRRDVPSLVFDWEHHVPFLAWTIVPYWSIDLLYALSLFICRTRAELNVHVKRLLTVQVISVCAFLLFPLRFSFERPHPHGLLGQMFDGLASFDKPFNQAPSLHVSLATILWAHYSRHLRDGNLFLLRLWLVLAAVSTMTTYQHHFIDVATGLWVGLFCIAFIPNDRPLFRRVTFKDFTRLRIGAINLAGFLALIALMVEFGGAAWALLWPAGALLIVACIYFIGQPALFRKQDGTMPAATVCLLAPYLAAAWLNSRFWTRNSPLPAEIADSVWLGRVPQKREREAFTSILDLTAELPVDITGVFYQAVPMLDLVPPTLEQLDTAVKAIEELESRRPTLVCCALGFSRSAAVAVVWLIASGRAGSVSESIALIKERRPGIVLGREQRERLEEWCNARLLSIE